MGNNKEFNMFNIQDVSEETELEENDVVDLYSFTSKKGSVKKNRYKESKFKKWWRSRKVWQKSAMISATAIIIIAALLFGIVGIVFDYNYNKITDNPDDLGFENVLDEDIVNVALFGLDTRNVNSFKGNSDSIMILSLNTKTKKVKIISVMRDTFTHMTYNGKTTYGKINSAYSKGGPELAIKTLNTIFGLDISEYATVNFYGMVDIINAIGGIEVELTSQEVTRNTNKKAINFCVQEICANLKLDPKDYYVYESGVQKLNGVQAVAYSRIRYVPNIWGTNNDYGRTDRQRYVMEQLFNTAITLDKTQYVKLAKSLIPCSETSLSYSEIISLAFGILLDSPTFEQTRMPQQEFLMTAPSGYGSVVYYDFDFAKDLIHAFIYDDISPEDYIATNGIQKNDWYSKMRGGSSTTRPSNGNSGTETDKPSTNTTQPSTGSDNDEDIVGNETDVSNNTGTSNGTGSSSNTSGGTSKPDSSTGSEATGSEGEDDGDNSTDNDKKPGDDSANSGNQSSSDSKDQTSPDDGTEPSPDDSTGSSGGDNDDSDADNQTPPSTDNTTAPTN